MVMGGGSCSEGCGFKSRGCILDGHDIFSHLFVVKNNNDVCLKRPKINKKRPGLAIFFKKVLNQTITYLIFLIYPQMRTRSGLHGLSCCRTYVYLVNVRIASVTTPAHQTILVGNSCMLDNEGR